MFDLDGTLTRRDTLLPYLLGFLYRRPARWWRVPAALPALARFVLGRADHGALKSAWIGAILGGCTRAELEAWTQRFVPRLINTALNPAARVALEQHRAADDRLVLLSASPDIYVRAIGHALRFDEVLCTGVAWEGERLTGRLTTANHRGPEKTRRLEALRLRHPGRRIIAYGNAASDLEHLMRADRGVLVNGTVRTRRLAGRLGLECRSWR